MTTKKISVSPIVERMADDLGLLAGDVRRIVVSAPGRYKKYEILKKNGGRRSIAQPSREVKMLQRWFMRKCMGMLRVHSEAMAYRKGRSIKDNVNRHISAEYILKMDFASFFPSIKSTDFKQYITTQAPWLVDATEIDLTARLLFHRAERQQGLRLAIGAPASPWLSNVIMFRFDLAVSKACLGRRVAYSRYADDLTFSSWNPEALREVECDVRRIVKRLKSPALDFNPRKTIMLSRKMQRRITGLILSNDEKISLGRERKRMIRAAVHHLRRGMLGAEETAQLRGLLAFAMDVEPDFVRRLTERYDTKDLFGTGWRP